MDLQTQTQLLSDYNFYRSETDHVKKMREEHPVAYLKPTKKRLDALGEMADFATAQRADPRMWLYMLFKSRHFAFAPRFDQLTPRTKKTAQKQIMQYQNLEDMPLFRRCIESSQQPPEPEQDAFDPNRDISTSAEFLKRRYLNEGDVQRCMDEMLERTFGFHPRSLVCARCPLAKTCAAKLASTMNFDILALRRGEITTAQARQINYYGR